MTNRITDFFKPYIVPRARIPNHVADEDEIIVRTPTKQSAPTKNAARRTVSLAKKSHAVRHSGSSPDSSSSRAPSSSLSTGPPRSPQRKSPQKRPAAIVSFDGANDEDDSVYHSSPPTSGQIEVVKVAIPSPKRGMSPPPPIRVERAAAPSRTAATSFSTLSSVAISSQSSSKRVIAKDGLHAVTNSDSASADDTDDDLADISTFIPRKKLRMSPAPELHAIKEEPQDTAKPVRQSKRLSGQSDHDRGRNALPHLPPSPPRTVYKHSLLSMVKASEKQKKQDDRIAAIQTEVAEADKRRQEQTALEAGTKLDAQTLAAELNDDSDDVERMQNAMERTEALQDEVTYHFFLQNPVQRGKKPFPLKALGDQLYARNMQDDAAREQACLTGFVAELAADRRCAPSVVAWFMGRLTCEPREELCEAYVEIIRQAASAREAIPKGYCPSLRSLYSTSADGAPKHASDAEQAFETAIEAVPAPSSLGEAEVRINCVCGSIEDDESLVCCEACDTWQHTTCYYPQHDGEALPAKLVHECTGCKPRKIDAEAAKKRLKRSLAELVPVDHDRRESEVVAPGLLYVVQAMRYHLAGTDVPTIGQAVVDLAFANVDDHVRKDLDVQLAIQDAIEGLLDDLEPARLDDVGDYARHRILPANHGSEITLCHLISALPAMSTASHYFRRRLASDRPLTDGHWFGVVAENLSTRPEWRIGSATDYARVYALTGVLDIAIDVGFSDFAFLDEAGTLSSEPAATGSGAPRIDSTAAPELAKAKSPEPMAPLFQIASSLRNRPSKDERVFNRYVDGLTYQVNKLAQRVILAGASHMSRMGAKALLEQLGARLECAVRTRPAGRRDVFGRGGAGGQMSLAGFAGRKTVAAAVVKGPLRSPDEATPMPSRDDVDTGQQVEGGAQAHVSEVLQIDDEGSDALSDISESMFAGRDTGGHASTLATENAPHSAWDTDLRSAVRL
ncbi:hypothetical protein LTR53_005099 [Teratosphaeriaceae sp. CCFEE 6253]|nr:hypothetical protein LTR53_005099 [Teratosphaeriaceae sp. CCFEE 6253]